MIGTIIAVAEGKLTKRDAYEMLTASSRNSWNTLIRTAPAHGFI